MIFLHITKEMLIEKYLSHYNPYEPQKISPQSGVGVITGLWANSLGNGGIIPIQVRYFITNNFHELKLTGMQGDVMKESMNVAKTLACSLAKTSGLTKQMLRINYKAYIYIVRMEQHRRMVLRRVRPSRPPFIVY